VAGTAEHGSPTQTGHTWDLMLLEGDSIPKIRARKYLYPKWRTLPWVVQMHEEVLMSHPKEMCFRSVLPCGITLPVHRSSAVRSGDTQPQQEPLTGGWAKRRGFDGTV
jgi:hypothetical protein